MAAGCHKVAKLVVVALGRRDRELTDNQTKPSQTKPNCQTVNFMLPFFFLVALDLEPRFL